MKFKTVPKFKNNMMKPNSVKKVPTNTSNIPKPPASKLLGTVINKVELEKKPLTKLQQVQKPLMTKTSTKFSALSSNKTINNKPSSVQKTQKQSVQNKASKVEQVKKQQSSTNKFLSKATTSSKNIHVYKQKPSYLSSKNNKKQSEPVSSWGYIPFDLFLMISHFYSHNVYDVYSLSLVCKGWRFHLMYEDGKYCWNRLKDCQKIQNFKGVKLLLQQNLIKTRQKMAVQYEKNFIKLFNYGSTKQNIPNKLIQKLNLEVGVQINKKKFMQKIPFKLRTYNFSSYLCFKLTDIQEFKYDFYTPHNMFKDKLNVKVKFFSRRYKVSHEMVYEMNPQDIVECAIRQKAFNYHLQKNLIFTFFQGDNHFLYFFFQISALQLVNIFRTSIAQSQKQIIKSALKKMPLHKKLAETQFESFVEYMKFQADFELHMSYHNSVKQIFTFCDTKVYPLKYDNKQAYFMINIDDTFGKVDTYKLDNKMGISEGVNGLYLLDLTLKDRDKFIITFSGFIYARKAELQERESVENYFNFAQNEMKIVEFKSKKYEFKVLIIEEQKKNFIKNIELIFYA